MLTLPEKRDRLRKLPNEVPEFHDWLQVVFQKMPNVAYVEHTHGLNEFGADFVLELTNSTTGRNEFVGVIAKKGTIKQDTSEVERQIRECGIPRIIKNGKDEQSLPIIWVVSNEGVTANAERKIRNDYRQYAIQFFSADDVILWTDKYAPHLWDELPSKISQYLNSVRVRLEELERSASLLDEKASDVKLELDLAVVDPQSYGKPNQKRVLVSLLDEVVARRIAFVEGGMGAGKSQLLRSLGIDLCSSKSYQLHKLLPIFGTYQGLLDQFGGSVQGMLTESLGELIVELNEERATAVLIIDGLDEVSIPETADGPLAQLAKDICELPRVHAAISCRSGLMSLATIQRTPNLRHLEVRPLSIRKMANFIRSICARAKLSNRIVRDLGRSELFRQLPQNPIAALLLTRLMLQSQSRDELPQTLTNLYARALELMLGRWDMEKGLGSQQEYEVARRICGFLGRMMIENEMHAIGIGDIEDSLTEYLKERNLAIDTKVLLNRLFSRSGVLALDRNIVSFKHKSFAEFFCAEEWLRTDQFHVDSRALTARWTTVYFFAIGLKADCEAALRQIAALKPTSEYETLGKIFHTPSYLLAGHMTPYRVVEDNLPQLLIEAARYYLAIVNGTVESKLRALPQLQALFLIQFLLRDRYGYQFFRKAIDVGALAIALSSEDDEVKAHALFFLGVIGIDLDYPDAMKFLAKQFEPSTLPIGLAAVVKVESDRAQPHGMSPELRAFNKRVYKMLKSNRSVRATLENLQKRPMDPNARLTEEERRGADRLKQLMIR